MNTLATFTVGSQAFFKDKPEFKPHDKDILMIVDEGNGFKFSKQLSTGSICYIYLVKHSVKDILNFVLQDKVTPLQVCKFFVPEVSEFLGMSLANFKKLEPKVRKLTGKHQYYQIIFDAYIANGSFTLSDKQLEEAYASYTDSRKPKEKLHKGVRNLPNETESEQ